MANDRRANVFAVIATTLWASCGVLAIVDLVTPASVAGLCVFTGAGAIASTCKVITDNNKYDLLRRIEIGRLTSLFVPGQQPSLTGDPMLELERVVRVNGASRDPHHMF